MKAQHINLEKEKELLEALQSELDYQYRIADPNDNSRADSNDNGLAGQIVTMSTYVRKAEDAWTLNPGNEAALNEIRKIAAICIRAMVQYGTIPRFPKEFNYEQ